MNDISVNYKDLVNKKIKKIEVIHTEHERTCSHYLCFTCENGDRVLLHANGPYIPKPSLNEMRKVEFYTPEEIGSELVRIEKEKRQRNKKINVES